MLLDAQDSSEEDSAYGEDLIDAYIQYLLEMAGLG
jgi:hypothetical protein